MILDHRMTTMTGPEVMLACDRLVASKHEGLQRPYFVMQTEVNDNALEV